MNGKTMIKGGEIGYLDPEENVIILKCSDFQTGEMEVLHVKVSPDVELQGIASLYDLEVGDEIFADVYQNDVSRVLKAIAIAR